MVKNLLIAFAATLVAWVVFSVLSDSSWTTIPLILILGITVFFSLQRMSSNRQEIRADDATRQSALSAVAPAGQALLYVYRDGIAGKLVGWNVSLDGKALAQLRSPRFTCTTVNPGFHTLAVSLGGFAAAENKPAETAFEAQPGEAVVFALTSKMGALSNTLSFVRESDSRSAMQKLSKIPMVR